MLAYFLIGMVLAAALCFGAYWLIQQKVLEEVLSLDDGKGYFLVACILIGFVLALGGFYTGQTLGFDQQEASSTLMALMGKFERTSAEEPSSPGRRLSSTARHSRHGTLRPRVAPPRRRRVQRTNRKPFVDRIVA